MKIITGSKVPFWQNLKIAKMALLNPCMKFENRMNPLNTWKGKLEVASFFAI